MVNHDPFLIRLLLLKSGSMREACRSSEVCLAPSKERIGSMLGKIHRIPNLCSTEPLCYDTHQIEANNRRFKSHNLSSSVWRGTMIDLPYSRFLFARPSAVEGVARLLDFGNMLDTYNFSPTAEKADTCALYADWCAVGDDLRAALQRLSERHHLNDPKRRFGAQLDGRTS